MAMCTNSNMKPTKKQMTTLRSITLAAMLLAILVAQEELLVLIPNVSFTTVLIMIYGVVLPLSLYSSVIIGYVVLDNLIMGSFIPVYVIPMILMWLLLGIVARRFKDHPLYVQVIIGILFAILYGWSFIPGNMILISGFKLWPYLLADFVAEGIMALSSAITIIFVYYPIRKLLSNFIEN